MGVGCTLFAMTTQCRRASFPTRAELIAIVFVILQLDLQIRSVSAEPLNSFVSHFEPLSYNRDDLEQTHQRVRRSFDEDSTLHLDFNAHGREFKLRLTRDTTIFAPDFEDDGDFDPTKVYKGHVDGHSGSSVHGFVHNGIFEGNINLSDKLEDGYHVEPSSDHFDTPKDFHSVIYKALDLHYPYSYGKDLDLSDKTKKWMEEARQLSDEHFSSPEQAPAPHRYKRGIPGHQKLICQIHLRADHLFTEKRARGDKERAKLLMSKHVQAVHNIYKETTFQIGGKSMKGFGFAIKKMRANSTDDKNAQPNPYAQTYIGVERFLDIISLEETSADEIKRYCLSHVFTYRDFEDGVLGLAWVGEAAGKAAGGICEIARRYKDGRKTLNTGVVTFVNYNKEVPSRVSEVTFAHELGHNFGAKHDPGQCSGQVGGNFIMFPKATSGADLNNRKFSSCSVAYVSPVIETKGQGNNGCFKATNASICGNQVVEKDEECDCGFDEDCKSDEAGCCNSATEANGCKLKSGKTCSPSQGLCCDKSCTYSSSSKRCNHGYCINDTFCSGSNAKCPDPFAKPNNTDCNLNQSVCLSGECIGSRCLKFKKQECQCQESAYQCVLCCKDGSNGACIRHNESDINLIPGAPCDNYQGYCDVLHKCRGVDSEGPLERIKNLLFGADAINNLIDWVKTYWWAAILIGIGLILLMAGFIKLCSVATPSSNPSKPKAKTMSLRRHPRANPGFVSEPSRNNDNIEMGDRRGRKGRH